MSSRARFGRFKLIERRGSGGMGEIWRAAVTGPRGFEQQVVLKRIRRQHAGSDAFATMLAAEARISARLRHPGFVSVFEFGEVEGEPYLAMELVDGWDLAEVLWACAQARRPAPAELVCHVGAEVAEALAYAHELRDDEGRPLGLIHRDVNPSNLMISRQGAVKLLDLGVHTLRDRWPDERTQAGVVKGTLAYFSPEQASGEPLDGRSDMFSLGVVLHEALTGARLFRVASDAETLERVRTRPIPPAGALRPGLDPRLEAAVARMLERAPAQRYPDCAALAAELRALAREMGADAVWARTFLASLPLEGGSADEASGRRTQRLVPAATGLRPWIIAAIITGLCVLPYAFAERPRRSVPAADTP